MQSIDLRQRDDVELRSFSAAAEIQFVNLSRSDVPSLITRGFGNLRSLSARYLRTYDLTFLEAFPNLEVLEVWQSPTVGSLTGIQALKRLRWLSLHELGPLPTLEPLSLLNNVEELLLTGGVWKDQLLSGSFEPLSALNSLRRLTITNVRGPTDLTPLLGFQRLEHLWFATEMFPLTEIARLAARYSFWHEKQPWLRALSDDPEGCLHCGGSRVMLFLRRKERIWCERCDADRLRRILDDFEALIQSYQQ